MLINELFTQMKNENFVGEIELNENRIMWKLSESTIIEVYLDDDEPEGIIFVNYTKKSLSTHWHPTTDEMFKELMEINSGNKFGAVKIKGFFFRNHLFIMDKDIWNSLSDRKKKQYEILGF